MKERKQYSKEFKQGAVRFVTEQRPSISDAAQSLGIPPWSLSPWVSSSKNDRCDNAVAESFFSALKLEVVYQSRCKGRQEAVDEVFDYIEVFYNRRRIHSANEYLSPVEYEERFKPAA